MKKLLFSSFLVALMSQAALAHTALMSCFDNGDGTITCEGGFSDGSSAAGVEFKAIQGDKVVAEGKFDKDSAFTFKKPEGEYKARMFAGEGHEVVINSKDIAE
ncbi:hypothetical protein CCAL9344_06670 [Campylobacter sp. RM9344]|uniref:Uncharacterized protein n=1 Tax=Campylobacter californiensis TaxID=1032243 RepID=A0AAW3ZRS7_9BACT|nr:MULTISPECIES: hypothetical protein [unclassified Campylobacter]MBE2984097.1 hypothetical protein [Campylobacter sp. RM6883]MBE2986278.1 hypothetical protein [Campylobacter sp. RM12919]MBE2988415.1 hypothetical protein [Campylobacter sp. RM12920]MBE2995759.1 hypothetical protein [Campylobacter sp. RM6913]MBE3021935.1 hypothetical protein [Campylobacter sp. 7477a]MBE3029866.1 hypothetical protein [Campylobacter sp. RM9344]